MASMIDYMMQTDASLANTRGKELENESQQMSNGFMRGNPEFMLYKNAPPGAAGQYIIGDALNRMGSPVGNKISKYNDALYNNKEANTFQKTVSGNTMSYRGLPAETKLQYNQQLQNMGYDAIQLNELINSDRAVWAANNNVGPDAYFQQFPTGTNSSGVNRQPSYIQPNQPGQPIQSPQGQPNGGLSGVMSQTQPQATPNMQAPVQASQGGLTGAMNQPSSGGGVPKSTIAQQQANQTAGYTQGKNLTSSQKNQAAWGQNLESSLDFVKQNIKPISSYTDDWASSAGLKTLAQKGLGRLDMEQNPEYQAYNTFHKTILPQLVNQATAMYHTSIQPEVREKLEREFQRSGDESAEMYETRINAVSDLIDKERKQFLKNPNELLHDPSAVMNFNSEYSPKKENKQNSNEERIDVVNKDGVHGHIPASQLEEALKEGYRRAG